MERRLVLPSLSERRRSRSFVQEATTRDVAVTVLR